MERVLRSMIHHPNLVAGPGEFDTDLMEMTSGELVSKTGAEGVQCIGRVGEGMGLAIKVIDGAKRAKHAAAIQLLKQLGWITPTLAETLSDRYLRFGYGNIEAIDDSLASGRPVCRDHLCCLGVDAGLFGGRIYP
jgi:L-asparaginase